MLKLNNQSLLFAQTIVFMKLFKFKRLRPQDNRTHWISKKQPMELKGDYLTKISMLPLVPRTDPTKTQAEQEWKGWERSL